MFRRTRGGITYVLAAHVRNVCGNSRDEYEAAAKAKFAEVGITLTSLHQAKDPVEAANKAEAFFGGVHKQHTFTCKRWEIQLMTLCCAS